MPVYLHTDRTETRAITNRVMAALGRLWDRLTGRAQHERDLCASLGRLSSAKLSEITVKR